MASQFETYNTRNTNPKHSSRRKHFNKEMKTLYQFDSFLHQSV